MSLGGLVQRAAEGLDLDHAEVTLLLEAQGEPLEELRQAADALRRDQVGDDVSYVVNRNINFTNVCVKTCRFCAFARGYRSEEGYRLSIVQVVARAVEAAALGATEVCLQAGLAPELRAEDYVALCRAVAEAVPSLHIHGFSPEEVRYAAARSGWTVERVLVELKGAGLGTMPGTSAEILVDEVRRRLAPGRLSTQEWIETVETAHRLGIRSTATIMYGHLETAAHRATHLLLLRDLQRRTGGFTELVPLSFVHREAPLWRLGLDPEVRPGATQAETMALFATARLVLGRDLPNLQASWVKEGFERGGALLDCGANDLGGTLMNESISTSAGAGHGQLATPATLRALIRQRGRVPVERNTDYSVRRRLVEEPVEPDALDAAPDLRLGSYEELVAEARARPLS